MTVLKTDLYQLTMAAGYFHRGMKDTVATCEMFVRKLPAHRNYLVACGVDAVIEQLASLRFDEQDIARLRQLPALSDVMTDGFVDYLRSFRFTGEVWSVREGEVMFASEPFVRVTAPIIEAQLIETFLLSTINHGTMIASKAARVVRAAEGRKVLEFGTRRVHPDAAIDAARAAYLVGATGTSNVEAGLRFGIPVVGTAAHMWTMTHDTEQEAFDNYVQTFPQASVLLIDTYDTVRGAVRAVDAAGERLKGVRLDSGDMDALSRQVRAVLDERGCPQAQIVASGDLNEYKVEAFVASGAPIDAFGVGTELVCSKDAPSLGGVYKVVSFERNGRVTPVAKFAEGKITYPGAHQIHRVFQQDQMMADTLALADEPTVDGARPLLERRIEGGKPVGPARTVEEGRAHAQAALDALPPRLHSLSVVDEGSRYRVAPSSALEALLERVRHHTIEENPS